jgi:anti-sigma regulatory factor (Ser/Thr protein kinase)
VGEIRRAARDKSLALGMSNELTGKVEIVATELATNLLKHAGDSRLLFIRPIPRQEKSGLELVAIDKGPGMADVRTMLTDGVSTAGTMGTGLGAAKRLSDEFEIYSKPGQGTAVLCRLYPGNRSASPIRSSFDIGGMMVPLSGEKHCGDGWATAVTDDSAVLLVVDGLGHGERAYQASRAALEEFRSQHHLSPGMLLGRIHENIRHTQGAVMAIAVVDKRRQLLTYCGIGNIRGRILNAEGSHGCISIEGLIGLRVTRVREFTYPWTKDAVLIMTSDGVLTGVESLKLADLPDCPSALVAAIVYNRFSRSNDDATVVVVREGQT